MFVTLKNPLGSILKCGYGATEDGKKEWKEEYSNLWIDSTPQSSPAI